MPLCLSIKHIKQKQWFLRWSFLWGSQLLTERVLCLLVCRKMAQTWWGRKRGSSWLGNGWLFTIFVLFRIACLLLLGSHWRFRVEIIGGSKMYHGINAIGSQMVEKVFHDVHQIGWDIMEGNCTIWATCHALKKNDIFLVKNFEQITKQSDV